MVAVVHLQKVAQVLVLNRDSLHALIQVVRYVPPLVGVILACEHAQSPHALALNSGRLYLDLFGRHREAGEYCRGDVDVSYSRVGFARHYFSSPAWLSATLRALLAVSRASPATR